MKKNFKIATMAYLIILGAVLGAVLYAGAVVAPVTFHSEEWLGKEILSRFQEGLIMTQNFVRLSYFIVVSIIAIILYEGYKYKMFERNIVTTLAALSAIMTGVLFNYYYLPDILTMQKAGEAMTKSIAFINTHKGSEVALTLFALSLLVLLIQTMRKACK